MTAIERHERRKDEMRASGRGHIIDSHAHSIRHRSEIEASTVIGCFHCMKTFKPSAIEYWIDGNGTAMCPHCDIDAIIGDASGYPVTDQAFLSDMNQFWFSAAGEAE